MKNEDMFMVQTNGGLKYCFCTASLHIFNLQVHYNPDSIETILAFKDVANFTGARINKEISKDRAMFVTLESK